MAMKGARSTRMRPESTLVPTAEPQLRRRSVGTAGVVGQSVSAMGLSGVIGTSVPVIALTAGAGGWLTWAIAAGIMMLVAIAIAILARRYATTGGLYGLTAKALGPFAGFLVGWLMVVLPGVALAATALAFGVYFSQFLSVFDVGYGRPVLLVTSVASVAGAWWLSRVGVRPAAWIMLITEILTTIAMAVVFVAVLVHDPGAIIDGQQLRLEGVSLSVILTAVVIAVAAFGGFESAAVYGQEAARPMRAIPIALVASVAVAGAVWMFSGYTLFLGFHDSSTSLAASAAPMGTLAEIAGIGWYRYVVDLSLSFTIVASLIAGMTWVARMMFTMSREGIAPASWQRVHPRFQTPSLALGIVTTILLGSVAVMASISATPLATFGGLVGDLSGYPLLLVYGLICLAAASYLWHRGRAFSVGSVVALVGLAGMAYVLYRSLVPFPTYPDNTVAGAFLGATATAATAYWILRRRGSTALARIGSTVDSDTAEVLAETDRPEAVAVSTL
jgi:amino acid transporter